MLQAAYYRQGQHFQLRFPEGKAIFIESPSGWQQVAPDSPGPAGRRLECQVERGKLWLRRRGATQPLVAGEQELVSPAQIEIDGGWFEFALSASGGETRPWETIEPLVAGASPFKGPSTATLKSWFDALGHLNRLAASSATFCHQAAQCVLETLRLQGVIILLCDPEDERQWHMGGSALPHPELGIMCPYERLDHVRSTRQTWFHGKSASKIGSSSALRDEILSPLETNEGKLMGVLYGYRGAGPANRRQGLRHLEARLFQLLAQTIGVAIERAERERLLAEQHVCLERSFPPAILRQVVSGEIDLAATEREVTLLMSDLRGFTSLCQHLSTEGSYQLLTEVMEGWTDSVRKHGGTLIDFCGDGLAAMWNAPADQPDHAALAVAAAQEMIALLPGISSRWRHRLAAPLHLGIGLHTGRVRVGNVGTCRQVKYGPRGIAVNLASRLEAANKTIGTEMLLTRNVARRLPSQMPLLRVCRARLKSFARPIDLFMVLPQVGNPCVELAAAAYRLALGQFELGEFSEALDSLESCPHGVGIPRKFLQRQIEIASARRYCRRREDLPETPVELAIPLHE